MKKVAITQHGKFVVKAGLVGDQIVARLFSATPRAFRGHILEGTGLSPSEATEQIVEDFLQRIAHARSGRRLDSITGAEVPTRFEFEIALRIVEMPERSAALLRKLPDLAAAQLTLEDFARVADCSSTQDVIDCLERVAASICAEADAKVPPGTRHTIILRIPGSEPPKDNTRIALQPEFEDALTIVQQGGQRTKSHRAA